VTIDEIAFDASVADLSILSADTYLNEILISTCEEALSRRPAAQGSLRAAVENAIVPLLPHGKAQIGGIAQRLGYSRRTLARRLAQEGLTFSDIVERLRNDLARQYLTDHGLSISQVAWLVGYREVSAFTHAFKRWTGETPRAARASRHAAPH
jgi:AraC-like DNA-binding protein